MKSIVCINPNLVVQRNDPFTTGIVYMPIGLAYTASVIREAGYQVKVIDAYAEAPERGYREGGFTIIGLRGEEVAERIPDDAAAIFVFAINLTNHIAAMNILRAAKRQRCLHADHPPECQTIPISELQECRVHAFRLHCSQYVDPDLDEIRQNRF